MVTVVTSDDFLCAATTIYFVLPRLNCWCLIDAISSAARIVKMRYSSWPIFLCFWLVSALDVSIQSDSQPPSNFENRATFPQSGVYNVYVQSWSSGGSVHDSQYVLFRDIGLKKTALVKPQQKVINDFGNHKRFIIKDDSSSNQCAQFELKEQMPDLYPWVKTTKSSKACIALHGVGYRGQLYEMPQSTTSSSSVNSFHETTSVCLDTTAVPSVPLWTLHVNSHGDGELSIYQSWSPNILPTAFATPTTGCKQMILVGTWAGTDMFGTNKWVLKFTSDGHCTIAASDKSVFYNGTYTTVPDDDTIDIDLTSGPSKGITVFGIYQTSDDGKSLKISFGKPGFPRPAKFNQMTVAYGGAAIQAKLIHRMEVQL